MVRMLLHKALASESITSAGTAILLLIMRVKDPIYTLCYHVICILISYLDKEQHMVIHGLNAHRMQCNRIAIESD